MGDGNGHDPLEGRVMRLEHQQLVLLRDTTALAAGDRVILGRIERVSDHMHELHSEQMRQLRELQAAVETIMERLENDEEVKAMRTSGPLKYVELESGGYAVAEDWWCEWDELPDWEARLNDGTGAVAGKRITLLKGYRCDGGSGPAVDAGGMHGFFLHDFWYRLGRQSKIPLQWRHIGDRLMFVAHRELDRMLWLRARWLWAGVRVGAADHFKPQADKETVVKVA